MDPEAEGEQLSDLALVDDILTNGEKPEERKSEPTKPEPVSDGDGEGDSDTEEEEEVGQGGDSEEEDEDGEPESGPDTLREARAALEDGDVEKALKLAFGKTPEFFKVNQGKWAAFRQAQTRAQQKHREREREYQQRDVQFQQQVQQVVAQLQPAADIIRAREAYQKTRDPDQLVKLIEAIAEDEYTNIQKAILHGQKLNPTARRMQAELEALKRQVAEREERERQQQRQLTVQQQKERDLQHIQDQLKGHKVSKAPRFAERVYRVLEKTLDSNGRLTMTIPEAADKVYRAERKRVQASPFYRKPTPAAAPPEEKPKKKPALRRDSQNNGAVVGEESDEDILQDIQRQIQRNRLRKAAG